MRLLVVALTLVGFAGCLQIDSPDGTLICSAVPKRPCPEGFYCFAGDNTCWRFGHYPGDMALPQHFQPNPPPDDLSVPIIGDDLGTDDGGTMTPADLSNSD